MAQDLFDDEGKRLTWVTTYGEDNVRRWVGIAEAGTWSSRFWVSSSRSAFLQQAPDYRNREGLRLTHIHTFIRNGVSYFVGLARSGTWDTEIIIEYSQSAFTRAAQEAFDDRGLRIAHVHTFMENGTRVWMGIARSGNYACRLFYANDEASFMQRAQDLFDDDALRLTLCTSTWTAEPAAGLVSLKRGEPRSGGPALLRPGGPTSHPFRNPRPSLTRSPGRARDTTGPWRIPFGR